MTIFDALTLIGGLCLFLFGMNIMGQALERRAGSSLQSLLGKLTTNRFMGFITGFGVTAIIQSSSATTVMVVGFVNSSLMTLRQAINVIMGANVGTTVTAWILSLGGVSGDSIFLKLLKPMSFTPVLALIGIVFYMFCKSTKKKDTGTILLGFATLMFGMDIMTNAVSGLKDIPAFQQLFVMFENPLFGVIVGALLTALLQSSSASVGILQALAKTGAVSYGAAIPIIMGQNIGTCITAILSSFGTNKNAKRAAIVHLSFNVIGTAVWLAAFWTVDAILSPALFGQAATMGGIATAHTIFNILCTLLLLPMSGLLEKLAYKLVPEGKAPEKKVELDERLLVTPSVALERCNIVAQDMAKVAIGAMKDSLLCLKQYSEEVAASVREAEDKTDHFEDVIGTYLVKLSTHQISEHDSTESTKLLKIIGDFERISDHAVNIVESAEEMKDKSLTLSPAASHEIDVLCLAVREILDLTLDAFINEDTQVASAVEPLEQVIDKLKDVLRTSHIIRLQKSECSIETGFVWNDIITSLERTSDHCSNIAGGVIDAAEHNLNLHESLRVMKSDSEYYKEKYKEFADKYVIRNATV
ncbi:MAG: Na/Pi cotransporter family protein [Ruminococcaceae bacterium]|nr:Na/Pi cotransporter family protein [Oscillospiraceae bacterium]